MKAIVQLESSAGVSARRIGRQAAEPGERAGKSSVVEFLGHVVRTMPGGDSRPDCAARKIFGEIADYRVDSGRRRRRGGEGSGGADGDQLSSGHDLAGNTHEIWRNCGAADVICAGHAGACDAKTRRAARSIAV